MPQETSIIPNYKLHPDLNLVRTNLFRQPEIISLSHRLVIEERLKTAGKLLPQRNKEGRIKSRDDLIFLSPPDDSLILAIKGDNKTHLTLKFKPQNYLYESSANVPVFEQTFSRQDRTEEELIVPQPIKNLQIIREILPTDLPTEAVKKIDGAWSMYLVGPDEQGQYRAGNAEDLGLKTLPANRQVGTVTLVRYQSNGQEQYLLFGKNFVDREGSATKKKILAAKITNLPQAIRERKTKLVDSLLDAPILQKSREEIKEDIDLPFNFKDLVEKKFSRSLGEDRFAYWMTYAWPEEELGPLDPVAIGLLSRLRAATHLSESDLPEVGKEQTSIDYVKKIIIQALEPTGLVRQLENQLALTWATSFEEKEFFSEIAPAYKKYLQREHGQLSWFKDLDKTPARQRHLLVSFNRELTEDPAAFFQKFYARNENVDGFWLGQQMAEIFLHQQNQQEQLANRPHELQQFLIRGEFENQLTTNICQDAVCQNLFRTLPKTDKSSPFQEMMAEFYQGDGKPKNKFARWVINGWNAVFGSENFDPLAVGILYSFRNELGLDDQHLPNIDDLSAETTRKMTLQLQALKPMIDRIEQEVAPAYLNFIQADPQNLPGSPTDFLLRSYSRNPNNYAFTLGTRVGQAIRDIYQETSVDRETNFQSQLEKQHQVFEQLMNGEYRGQRSEIANHAYRVLYKISHLREKVDVEEKEKRMATFSEKAEKTVGKLTRIGFTAGRLMHRLTSSSEGESMFKPGRGAFRRGALTGLAAAEGYRWMTDLTESSLSRPIQLGFLGAGFILGRSNPLKDIRWANVGKTLIRGVSSYAFIQLADIALKKTGVFPQTVTLLGNIDIPLQATMAKMIVGNVFSSLGMNFTSEALVNWRINHKPLVDRLTEYLFFKDVNPSYAKRLLTTGKKPLSLKKHAPPQPWTRIADFLETGVVSFEDLKAAAETAKESREVLMTLMISNPTRYSRHAVVRNNHTYYIDNQEMVARIEEIQRKLHHAALQLPAAQREQICDLLEEDETAELASRITHRLRKTKAWGLVATSGVNLAWLAAFHAKDVVNLYADRFPFLKRSIDYLQAAVDTIFGKAHQVTPQMDLNSLPENAGPVNFVYSERMPADQLLNEVSDRMNNLYQLLSIVKDQNLDPAVANMLCNQYQITPQQLTEVGNVLANNQLTGEDIYAFLAVTKSLQLSDDQVVNLIGKALSGSDHNNLGKLAEALTSQGNQLKTELAESVRGSPNLARGLYLFQNHLDQSLLSRLGIDSQSPEYQLGFTDLNKSTINSIVKSDTTFVFEHNQLVVKKGTDLLVEQLSSPEYTSDKYRAEFALQILQKLYSADPKDLQTALADPDYAHFLGEISKLRYTFSDSDSLLAAIKNSASNSYQPYTYLREIYNLTSQDLGENQARKLIQDAVQGDPQAFILLHQSIQSHYPGQLANLFDNTNDTLLERMINYSRGTLLQESDLQENLLKTIKAYQTELGLVPPAAQATPLWQRSLLETPTNLGQEAGLAQLFNGQIPLERGLSQALNLSDYLFTNEGQVVGYYSNAFFLPRATFPETLVTYVDNIEGPLHHSSLNFFKTLVGRNIRVLFDKTAGGDLGEIDYSGASDPAMQLAKVLMNHYNPTDPSYYNAEYLSKLVVATLTNHVPKEMNYLFDATQSPPSIPAPEVNPSDHFDSWARLFNLNADSSLKNFFDNIHHLGKDAINELCYKFEQYLLGQRLIRIYGKEVIYQNYLNYVYLGSVNGVPIHGMEAGAELYFGKTVENLNNGEMLILTGMAQQPSGYSPLARTLTPAEIAQGITSADQIIRNVALNRVNLLLGKGVINQTQAQHIREQIAQVQFTNQPPDHLTNVVPDQAQASLAKALAQPTPTAGNIIDITNPADTFTSHSAAETVNALSQTGTELPMQKQVETFLAPMLQIDHSGTVEGLVSHPQTIDQVAQDLEILINNGQQQNLHGDKLYQFLTTELNKLGVPLDSKEAQDSIRYFAASTIDQQGNAKAGQCFRAVQAVTGLNFSGSDMVADIGGWPLTSPKDILKTLYGSLKDAVTFENTILIKFHSVDQLNVGDHIVIDNPSSDAAGHVALIIKKGVNSLGQPMAEIFDVNADEHGTARIITVTNDNINSLLTHQHQAAIVRLTQTFQDNAIVPTSSLVERHQDVFTMAVHNPEIPGINQVDVPVFQSVGADGSVIEHPGIALSIIDSEGHQLADFNPTGVLGKVPILPGSTIKPFIYAFLRMKGINPDIPLPNQPGQFTLDGSTLPFPVRNPISYTLLNSLGSNNTMTLKQALAVSTNVVFQREMVDLQKDNPELWIEFQQFLRQFGLELTDIYGNELRTATAVPAIGSDAYVRSVDHLAFAYTMLANPEHWFKDQRLVAILDETRTVLMDDNLKKSVTGNGFSLSALGQQELSSACNGIANTCFTKTGTVGGTFFNAITQRWENATTSVLTANIIKLPDGHWAAAVAVEAGQQVTADGQIVQTNLDSLTVNPWGSMMVLPWLRTLMESLATSPPLAGQ